MTLLGITLLGADASAAAGLSEKVWIHGSEDCTRNRDPAIEVFRPKPTKISMSKFAIVPISAFQRTIGDFLKWITRG